jgi:hypothetical protein
LKLLLWKRGEPLKILRPHLSKKIYAMVGPEGGFTEGEVKLAKERVYPNQVGSADLANRDCGYHSDWNSTNMSSAIWVNHIGL